MYATIDDLIARLTELKERFPEHTLCVLQGEFVGRGFWFSLKDKVGEDVTGFIYPEVIRVDGENKIEE